MKLKHTASGTEFTQKENGNFEITKQGFIGDCWINKKPIGYAMRINYLDEKLAKSHFEILIQPGD